MAHANGTVAAIHLQLYSLWHVPICASRTVFRTYLVLAKLMNILQDLSVIIVIPSRLSTLTQYISTTIPGPSCRGVLAGLPHTTYRLPDRAPLGGSWYLETLWFLWRNVVCLESTSTLLFFDESSRSMWDMVGFESHPRGSSAGHFDSFCNVFFFFCHLF